MLYYISNFGNFDNTKKLLDNAVIKILNSIILPNTNISNLLNLSNFLNLKTKECIDSENKSDDSSENQSEEDIDINENSKDVNFKEILILNENDNSYNDLIYNMQNCINDINIKDLTFKLNDKINKNLSEDKVSNSSDEFEIENAYSKNKKNLNKYKNKNNT